MQKKFFLHSKLIFLIIILILIQNINNLNSKNINNNLISLKNKKIIQLIENDSIFISYISSIRLSPKEDLIAICNAREGNIIIYDTTGSIKYFFKPNIYLSDSIAIHFKPQYSWLKEANYLTIDERLKNKDRPIDIEIIKKQLINNYQSLIFLDDRTISIGASLKVLMKITETDKSIKLGLDAVTGIIKLNLNNSDFSIIKADNSYLVTGMPTNIFFDKINNQYLLFCTKSARWKQGKTDSLWVLSYFNEKGEFIKPVLSLPEEYIKSHIGYNESAPLIAHNDKDKIFAAFPLILKIYDIINNTSFNLTNLTVSNEDIFKKLITKNSISYKEMDDLLGNFPVIVEDIFFSIKNEIIVVLYSQDKTNPLGPHFIIQKYKSNGEFISDFKMDYKNEFGTIQKILYNKIDNSLILCCLSKDKGYTLIYKELIWN